ncbi:hypothetical protein JX580_04110 [Thiomicrospira microaerophila]|uniref:hypothetical protein n=1 Tax=Thiomicrospira microaerophila TaxID=406020 RepID=UPI00200D73A0|nr:hypothetical protein [Thiomicrospira microaerophila]UQB43073.1 hypothetical protein JX580_04110 [Thiomicrospira microaerophila]
MIVQHSSINLNHQSNQFQYLNQTSQLQGSSKAAMGSSAGLSSLALSTQYQFDARHHHTSVLQSRSEVQQQGLVVAAHHMAQTSAKLSAIQLNASSAQIAIKQAFPSDSSQGVQVSGLAEFQFKQQIQYRQASHNVMSASGQVSLADGRKIDFNLHLQHLQHTEINALSELSLQQSVMHDPLVINFGDQPVALRNTTFEFDLLANGQTQTFAALGQGAGYLTFDLNGDGMVTDGSELFGTRTGDAYAELALFDEDRNGWIDQNDAIFSQLRIWLDQTDPYSTISLAEAGVGAIYLGSVPFEYALRDDKAALQGQSKAASIVLMEDGRIKTSQAIDLMPLITSENWQFFENTPAFKSLQRMADSLNSWFEKLNQIQTSMSFNSAETQLQTSTTSSQENWFETLQKKIQQMVNERKALLEGVLGKRTSREWGRA